MGILKLIGAVSAAEHERKIEVLEDLLHESRAGEKLASEEKAFRLQAERRADDYQAKFRKATEVIATQADSIASFKKLVDEQSDRVRQLKAWHQRDREEIAALRPDAEKWRDRAARELQRGQAKRDAAAPTKAVAAKGRGK